MSFANYPFFDALPSTKGLKTVLIAQAYGTSQTGNNDAGYVINSSEDTRWTSKGLGEAVIIDLSDPTKIKRIDIEWDPTLPRTGTFEIALTPLGKELPFFLQEYKMNGMLWSSITFDQPMKKASVVTIKCFGNETNDLNGMTHVKLWS